jgi:hypothetical protein
MVDFSQADIDRQLDAIKQDFEARLAAMESRHQEELAAARSQAMPVLHNVPEHAGGPGTVIRNTWSQYEQELSRSGAWQEPESD